MAVPAWNTVGVWWGISKECCQVHRSGLAWHDQRKVTVSDACHDGGHFAPYLRFSATSGKMVCLIIHIFRTLHDKSYPRSCQDIRSNHVALLPKTFEVPPWLEFLSDNFKTSRTSLGH